MEGSPVRDTICLPKWSGEGFNNCFSKDDANHLDFLLFNDYQPYRNSMYRFPADGVLGLSPNLGTGYKSFGEHLRDIGQISMNSVALRNFNIRTSAILAFGDYNENTPSVNFTR